MDAVTYSDLRHNLKTYLDKAYHDHNALIVTRKNNENLVILSMDAYNRLMETNYLFSSKANTRHLEKSIRQFKQGKVSEREIDIERLPTAADAPLSLNDE